MAKGAYIGVDGKARKIKKGYVGVTTEFPVYGDPVSTSVTVSNIAEFFDVKNDTHYFKGSGGTFANTNGGVDDSTAKTTLTAKVDMEVSFYYSYSTEPNYDKFTLVVGTTTVEKEASGSKTTKSYSGNLSVGESIVFTYTKDGSQAGNDDRCAFSTIVVKSAPIVGTETKSVARKIKKAYIGIGGVARPCWSGDELVYYGTITPLSVARRDLAATSVGNYAIFAGGQGGTAVGNVVDAYNSSLVLSKSTTWNAGYRYWMAATSVGSYALFGGGRQNGSVVVKTVQSYNKSLTYSVVPNLQTTAHSLAATTVGNYALFGGGDSSTYSAKNQVTSYNDSLTQSSATSLSSARYELAATTVGNYALFGGGQGTDGTSAVVDTYTSSLTKGTATSLSVARNYLAATTVGDYALFGGGQYSDYVTTVDAYNASLTRSIPTALSVARQSLAATSVGNYALFGGGERGGLSKSVDTVDIYDASLTRTTTNLSVARCAFAATTVGNYALFGGGHTSANNASAVVDAFTVV